MPPLQHAQYLTQHFNTSLTPPLLLQPLKETLSLTLSLLPPPTLSLILCYFINSNCTLLLVNTSCLTKTCWRKNKNSWNICTCIPKLDKTWTAGTYILKRKELKHSHMHTHIKCNAKFSHLWSSINKQMQVSSVFTQTSKSDSGVPCKQKIILCCKLWLITVTTKWMSGTSQIWAFLGKQVWTQCRKLLTMADCSHKIIWHQSVYPYM